MWWTVTEFALFGNSCCLALTRHIWCINRVETWSSLCCCCLHILQLDSLSTGLKSHHRHEDYRVRESKRKLFLVRSYQIQFHQKIIPIIRRTYVGEIKILRFYAAAAAEFRFEFSDSNTNDTLSSRSRKRGIIKERKWAFQMKRRKKNQQHTTIGSLSSSRKSSLKDDSITQIGTWVVCAAVCLATETLTNPLSLSRSNQKIIKICNIPNLFLSERDEKRKKSEAQEFSRRLFPIQFSLSATEHDRRRSSRLKPKPGAHSREKRAKYPHTQEKKIHHQVRRLRREKTKKQLWWINFFHIRQNFLVRTVEKKKKKNAIICSERSERVQQRER